MKWLIAILLLMSIPIALAFPQCEDRIEVNKSCDMITPELVCTNFTYNIIDTINSLEILNDSNLTLIAQRTYKFEFNQTAGEYLIILCSNHTRTLRVNITDDQKFQEETQSRMFIAIAIIVTFTMALLGWLAINAKQQELKLIFGYFMVLMIVVGFGLAIQFTQISSPGESGLINFLVQLYNIAVWLMVASFFILFVLVLYKSVKLLRDSLKKRKRDKEEAYLFDEFH